MADHTCRAIVFRCMDFRLRPGLLSRLLEVEGYWEGTYDLVSVAGSAKDLVAGNEEDGRFLLKQIKRALELHGARETVFLLHDNCGAYGIDDPDQERQTQESDLSRLRELLHRLSPRLIVKTYRVTGTATGQLRLERVDAAPPSAAKGTP